MTTRQLLQRADDLLAQVRYWRAMHEDAKRDLEENRRLVIAEARTCVPVQPQLPKSEQPLLVSKKFQHSP